MDHELVYETKQRTEGNGTCTSDREAMRRMLDENALLHKAHAFDQDALAQIHEAYYGAMYRYISFRVDDLWAVEDLTSEVFTRFLVALRKPVGRPNSIRAWLYGTASRVLKEYYRSRVRLGVVGLDESVAVEEMGPVQATEEMWTRRELHEAIQELTEDQKTVLSLRFGGNLAIHEVSTLMKRSEGAVKMLQVRAVSALARKMVERK